MLGYIFAIKLYLPVTTYMIIVKGFYSSSYFIRVVHQASFGCFGLLLFEFWTTTWQLGDPNFPLSIPIKVYNRGIFIWLNWHLNWCMFRSVFRNRTIRLKYFIRLFKKSQHEGNISHAIKQLYQSSVVQIQKSRLNIPTYRIPVKFAYHVKSVKACV